MKRSKYLLSASISLCTATLGAVLLFSSAAQAQPTMAMRKEAVHNVVTNTLTKDHCESLDNSSERKKCEDERQCRLISFYWEIGDANGPQAHGRKGLLAPLRSTKLKVASASKWLFAAYVIQKEDSQLTQNEIHALNMTAGYTQWSQCGLQGTVGGCFHRSAHKNGKLRNDTYDPSRDGAVNSNSDNNFVYSGANDQWLATTQLDLSEDTNQDLKIALQSKLGDDIHFSYHDPGLSYGIRISTANYAIFLRKILSGGLQISNLLGSHSVPAVCKKGDNGSRPMCTADQDPVHGLLHEQWHYSLGHWVEDDSDATVHDGAFSSPGAFGYYPWIDADKTYYGVLARRSLVDIQASKRSVQCGRQIRAAWENPQNYL